MEKKNNLLLDDCRERGLLCAALCGVVAVVVVVWLNWDYVLFWHKAPSVRWILSSSRRREAGLCTINSSSSSRNNKIALRGREACGPPVLDEKAMKVITGQPKQGAQSE
ncbi:hypothetical protein FRC14_006217 [Serendipita sp. 396]|nr:hypothetical protein FRC14_006217 [Serendipita sp. 396]KAG8813342.1 hypothetical protein FRC18_002547 [Serendipita sp. 400]KAG8878057.1 hypothetical protein FRC20_009342 [Serendipita sp. 405]